MGSYDKVQFMSWELHTGPEPRRPEAEAPVYRGLPDQEHDIAARLAFAADAVARAELFSDHRASTLKIFLGPCRLFRGAGADYAPAPEPGGGPAAPPASLRAGLRAMAVGAPYGDWVFVVGAALLGPAGLHDIALVQHRDHDLGRCSATGGALFQMPGVADRDGHAIDLRVVPDLGLDLQRPCTSRPISYALYCSGLCNPDGTCGRGTRLWGGAAPLAGAPWRCVEASRDAAHVGTELVTVASTVPTALGMVSAGRLWNQADRQGAGKVRMIAPLTL